MPLTPLHLGPVIPIKATLPGGFSLGVFTVVQMVIDAEALWGIFMGVHLHGPLHTLLGAVLAATAIVAPAKYGLTSLYTAVKSYAGVNPGVLPSWLVTELGPISWGSAMIGGLAGGVSHVLLDAIIHWDVAPFAPWSPWNPLFVPGSFLWVHLLCGVLGGGGLLWWRHRIRSRCQ